ncbi:hypothetical protein J6590_083347 [Homalodisca vitripennis]|nr:hypothetical protein J6590_083347 [Homalodisca vitripennis]
MERQHGKTGFFLTQFLSGHGYFGSYPHRMEKRELPASVHGYYPRAYAQYAFFRYRRCTEERRELTTQLQEDLQPQTIIGVITRTGMLGCSDQILGESPKAENVQGKRLQLSAPRGSGLIESANGVINPFYLNELFYLIGS